MTYIRLAIVSAVLIALLSLAGLALWYRGNAIDAAAERDKALASLATAVQANRDAQDAIAALQEQSRFDGRLTASLVEELRKISVGLADQSKALSDLEQSNAAIRDYLNLPVPADLCRLYDRC